MHRFSLPLLATFALAVGLAPFAPVVSSQAKDPRRRTKDKKKTLPLAPERKIEFTTDEGTWISLDVAPDGQTIVFELLGDLYTLPVAGGQARPLTEGMAFDSQPRFSTDGKRIVFLSDREGAENVWTMAPNGADARAITKDEKSEFASPSFTPDGDYVLVSKMPDDAQAFELWMYHVKGGSGVQVTKAKPKPETEREKQTNVLGALASPDGRHFYYARRTGGFQYNILQFPLWQVVRRDRLTGDEDPITDAPGAASGPCSLRTAGSSSTARATRRRRGCASATSRRGRTAGSTTRCSATTRSRARPATCSRATRSRPTAARWWRRSTGASSASTWPPAKPRPFPSPRPSRRTSAPSSTSRPGWTSRTCARASSRVRCRAPTANGSRSRRSLTSTSWTSRKGRRSA